MVAAPQAKLVMGMEHTSWQVLETATPSAHLSHEEQLSSLMGLTLPPWLWEQPQG
jgi:hypothetical protein